MLLDGHLFTAVITIIRASISWELKIKPYTRRMCSVCKVSSLMPYLVVYIPLHSFVAFYGPMSSWTHFYIWTFWSLFLCFLWPSFILSPNQFNMFLIEFKIIVYIIILYYNVGLYDNAVTCLPRGRRFVDSNSWGRWIFWRQKKKSWHQVLRQGIKRCR